jgi:hypothetical protein
LRELNEDATEFASINQGLKGLFEGLKHFGNFVWLVGKGFVGFDDELKIVARLANH